MSAASDNSKPLEQLRSYTEALSGKRVEDEPAYKNWQLAKQTIWLTLLVASFLIFYLVDILLESFILLTARF